MKRIYSLFTISVFGAVGFCFFAGVNIRAQEITVKGKIDFFQNAKKPFEPSAVAPIGNKGKYLLVANDKKTDLLIVETATRKIIRSDLSMLGYDWEAMAKDSEGNYYLIGSQAELIYFGLDGENEEDAWKIKIKPPISLNIKKSFESVRKELNLSKESFPQIEGLAILEDCGTKQLVVGIRQTYSAIISIYRVELTSDKELSLKRFFQFDTSKVKNDGNVVWHLSSIEYVADWKGFLIVVSTEGGVDKFYGNMLWFVSNEELKKAQQSSLAGNFRVVTPLVISKILEKKKKAEGLTLLESVDKSKLNVAIVFDNDESETRIAAEIMFAELSKAPK